jgi:ribonuclease Z
MEQPVIKDFTLSSQNESDGDLTFFEDECIRVFPMFLNDVISYSIHLPSFRGKIDLLALERCHVKKHQIKEIVKHGTLMIDGQQVTLDMISGSPKIGRILLIFNCPTSEYITTLASHPYLQQLYMRDRDILVIHFTTSEIYNSAAYSKILVQSATHQFCDISQPVGLPFYQQQIHKLHSKNKYFHRATGLTWKDRFVEYELYPKFTKTILQYEDLDEMGEEEDVIDHHIPLFTAYGTGSAIPLVNRNVSGYCLRYKKKSFLLDPGEDTLRSILFSAHEKTFWESLVCIYVSHEHADHHGGLHSILQRWSQFTREQNLYLIVPSKVRRWVMKYFEEASNRLRYTSDEVVTIPVDHPGEASACKIVIDGFTFVYSGDTMYSKDLATLAKDADLIVHECTFENDQKENAKEKRHSTLGDALRVFRESNPKRMISFIPSGKCFCRV